MLSLSCCLYTLLVFRSVRTRHCVNNHCLWSSTRVRLWLADNACDNIQLSLIAFLNTAYANRAMLLVRLGVQCVLLKVSLTWTQLHRYDNKCLCSKPVVSEQTTVTVCGQKEMNVMWHYYRSMCGQYGPQIAVQPLRHDLLYRKLHQPDLLHLSVHRSAE
jgi:hypothetical protein